MACAIFINSHNIIEYMSKEVKLGILTIITAVMIFFALNFIKGNNIFSESMVLKAKYSNVAGLDVSSPVYLNGFKVGAVNSIALNPENINEMIVVMRIEGSYKLPKSTRAVFRSDGLVSGNAIALKFDQVCSGANCVKDGDFIQGEKLGMLGSMFTDEEIDQVSGKLKDRARDVIDNIGNPDSQASIDITAREMKNTMQNMTLLTEQSNRLLRNSSKGIQKTVDNLAMITENVAASNAQITNMLVNLEKLTKELSEVKFAEVTGKASTTLVQAEKSMQNLTATLATAEKTFSSLNQTLDKVNNGDGSLNKLLTDKTLYTNLESTSKQLSLLLQDMRLNPKRYVSISVFGKKQDNYISPEDDPALKN